MSDICERLAVHCPDHEAAQHLASFFASHAIGEGTVAIAVRNPFGAVFNRTAERKRRVVARLYPLHSLADRHPTYSVSWLARDGGTMPAFAGALAIEVSAQNDCVGLVVSGHYEPPFGLAGPLFDATVGRAIARASARDLLHSIAAFVQDARAQRIPAYAG